MHPFLIYTQNKSSHLSLSASSVPTNSFSFTIKYAHTHFFPSSNPNSLFTFPLLLFWKNLCTKLVDVHGLVSVPLLGCFGFMFLGLLVRFVFLFCGLLARAIRFTFFWFSLLLVTPSPWTKLYSSLLIGLPP